MSFIPSENIRSVASLIPGGSYFANALSEAASGAFQGAAWAAGAAGGIGARIAGGPGEALAAMLGAGAGAAGGFLLGPILGRNLVPGRCGNGGSLPLAARVAEAEDAFCIYLIGAGTFGEDVQNNQTLVQAFDLCGQWQGYAQGFGLDQTPAPELFQTPPSSPGPIAEPPVPRHTIASWTLSYFALRDGSSISSQGIARTHLIPIKDGGILDILVNAHVLAGGTGPYEDAQGIKQGIAVVYIPPNTDLKKQQVPGAWVPINALDTIIAMKKNLFAAPSQPGRSDKKAIVPIPSAAVTTRKKEAGDRELAGAASTITRYINEVGRNVGAIPFDLRLPDLTGKLTTVYRSLTLFRRYGVGKGAISNDKKYFRFKGQFYLLDTLTDEIVDGSLEGIYEFLAPLTSLDAPVTRLKLPSTFETVKIPKMQGEAFSKEIWRFSDGRTLTLGGSALLRSIAGFGGNTVFGISGQQIIIEGSGEFEGARGAMTSGLSLVIPPGESPATVTNVLFKSLNVFAVVPKRFIGTPPKL